MRSTEKVTMTVICKTQTKNKSKQNKKKLYLKEPGFIDGKKSCKV